MSRAHLGGGGDGGPLGSSGPGVFIPSVMRVSTGNEFADDFMASCVITNEVIKQRELGPPLGTVVRSPCPLLSQGQTAEDTATGGDRARGLRFLP